AGERLLDAVEGLGLGLVAVIELEDLDGGPQPADDVFGIELVLFLFLALLEEFFLELLAILLAAGGVRDLGRDGRAEAQKATQDEGEHREACHTNLDEIGEA